MIGTATFVARLFAEPLAFGPTEVDPGTSPIWPTPHGTHRHDRYCAFCNTKKPDARAAIAARIRELA